MVSISSASRLALANLRAVNADLATTQNRISSGLRINSAKDDAAVWRTASGIRSDLKMHDAVDSGLTAAKANVDAAAAGAETIATALTDMKAKIAQYQTAADADSKTVVFNQIKTLQTQITAALSVSGGTNLLDGTSYSFLSSVGASGSAGTTTFASSDIKAALTSTAIGSTVTTFLTTFVETDMSTSAKIAEIVTSATSAVSTVTNYAAKLGSVSEGIAAQQTMNKALASVKETALSAMVDANLEEESAKLQALQVKQQLAYQTLSIGNASSQNILRLFQ